MIQSRQQLKKQYSFKAFLFYIAMVAIPLLTAILAIARHSMQWAVLYVFFAIGMLALVLKFYCTRCPHYKREGKVVKCLFIWGLPKLFASRPGALNKIDITVAFGAALLLALFPVYWLILEPGLLIIYGLSFSTLLAAVRRSECERCIYFECPANKVPESLRNMT